MHLFYGFDGEPITPEVWQELMESPEQRVIAQQMIGTRFVSTVWMGTDMSFGSPVPLIYETMVFDQRRAVADTESADTINAIDDYTQRYPTREAAVIGHNETVAVLGLDDSMSASSADSHHDV